MKSLFTCLLISTVLSLTANGTIESVIVDIDIKEGNYSIKQSIAVLLTNEDEAFLIRALPVKEAQLFIDSILVDNERVSSEVINMTGTLDSRIELSAGNKIIDIYYQLSEIPDEFTIPIFFTSLAASNSETDFFKATISTTIDYKFIVQFPMVPLIEEENGMYRVTSFQLPSSPSMIRVKKGTSSDVKSSGEWVDWGVGFVFLIIGVLLWINRKKLTYG
jgi:hypothetical protein